MKNSSQQPDTLEAAYKNRYDSVLVRLARNLDKHIHDFIKDQPRIDRISTRAKDPQSFLMKARTEIEGIPKYDEPLKQIQDQIGARIVGFYKSDIGRIDAVIKRYFTPIEYRTVVPDSESEFGYFGQHLILVVPTDVIEDSMDRDLIPEFFELQIKTLFQHSWAEANHDLAYKPGETLLTSDQKRLVAFTSAQAWGADHMFDLLQQERNFQ